MSFFWLTTNPGPLPRPLSYANYTTISFDENNFTKYLMSMYDLFISTCNCKHLIFKTNYEWLIESNDTVANKIYSINSV